MNIAPAEMAAAQRAYDNAAPAEWDGDDLRELVSMCTINAGCAQRALERGDAANAQAAMEELRQALNEQPLEDDTTLPKWPRLKPDQQHRTLNAMQRYGGGFVQALARAWLQADPQKAAALGNSFDNEVRSYGPGSPPYAALHQSAEDAAKDRALVHYQAEAALIQSQSDAMKPAFAVGARA